MAAVQPACEGAHEQDDCAAERRIAHGVQEIRLPTTSAVIKELRAVCDQRIALTRQLVDEGVFHRHDLVRDGMLDCEGIAHELVLHGEGLGGERLLHHLSE